MWKVVVKDQKGRTTEIMGDWRPMRNGLDSAFDISSDEFPYVSPEKIRKNVIGQEIEYVPDEIFGATSWKPTYQRRKLKKMV